MAFERLDFDQFHRQRVPELLAGNGPLATATAGGLRPVAFRLPDGRAWTYAVGDDGLEVRPGDDDAATVVALTEDDWSDFANEARTCFGLLYAGPVTFPSGSFEWLDRWEPALRALYHGRPPYDPAAVAGVDLTRSFSPDDDLDTLRAHLDEVGFLRVRALFSVEEIDAVKEEIERLQRAARTDDRHTWWARDRDGNDVCCRLIYTAQASPVVAAFVDDHRLHRLGQLVGDDPVQTNDRLDGVSVVIKNPSVVEGLSDLPWHRDCGLGGHPVLCPTVLIGIQLDPANRDTGQLQFLAGSHRTTGSPPAPGMEDTLPIVGIDAEPGDVTVHLGHVMHVAPPPEGGGACRRTMYVSYSPRRILDDILEGQGYNDVLFTGRQDSYVQAPESITLA